MQDFRTAAVKQAAPTKTRSRRLRAPLNPKEVRSMRPNQQNRRMRGRNNNNNNSGNNNNRKGQNTLNRNYESNGPDVKIRGSAQQIAEKYTTLARDAHSSGDRVMAENYLQHAEHYNRIIAAAQLQMPNAGNIQQGQDDDDDNVQDNDFDNQDFNEPRQQQIAAPEGAGPQPVIEGMPAEVSLEGERPQQRDRNFRNRDRNNRPPREPREPRDEIPVVSAQPEPVAVIEAVQQPSEAVRRPRRPRRPADDAVAVNGDDAADIGASGLLATLSRGARDEAPASSDE